MTRESIVGPDGGEIVRLGPATVRILEDGATTGHRLGIGEITVAPHSSGPPQHRHARHDEGFYVVSGTARFTIGATEYDAPAGTLAMIPPGAPHTFANPGDEPLVLLNTFTPDLYVQYFRDLRELAGADAGHWSRARRGAAGGRGGRAGHEPVRHRGVRPVRRRVAVPSVKLQRSLNQTIKEIAMSSKTYTLPMSYGDVPVTVTERGAGAPVLLLHGGAGPGSFAGFADQLAARFPFRVLTPVNPGFDGTPRPEGLDSVRKLAEVYGRLLAELDLTGVTVVGNSIGGWVAAELALAAPDRVARLVIIDSAGLDSADHPMADFYSLTLDQVTELSWANPEGHRIDLSALTDAQRAIAAATARRWQAYGGPSMADPTLAARLSGVTAGTLVVWGEADRMMTPGYGKEYAAAIPGASFRLLPGAGHLPQLETPEAVLALFAEA